MGTLNNICKAKCEVLAALKASDFALINGDNELLIDTARGFECKKYTFGYSQDCDIQIINVETLPNGIDIEIRIFDMKKDIFLPIPAPKLATNVASAAGMAFLLGVDWEDIKKNLGEYKTSSNRLNITNLQEGGAVINDTYNANPVSMMAALEVSTTLARKGRTVAVLGDMLELGEYEVSGHMEVGKRAAELGIDLLIAVGERSRDIARGAVEAGMQHEAVKHFNLKQDSLAWLKKNVNKKDIVLFKASRGMKLETLLEEWMA
jgi:UDP-N-acetylmuramoyl-tripeptide--D-alanyl-D-alanine ligase